MNTFNNQNTHLSNLPGNAVSLPNRPPSMPFPCFPNVAAGNHLTLNNGHVGMPPQNLSQIAPLPPHGQFCNMPQNINPIVPPRPHGHFLFHNGPQNLKQLMHLPHWCLQAHNLNQNMPMQSNRQLCSHNLPQNIKQIIDFPNGQFCSQNLIQNLNHVMPMQCSQHSTEPFSIHTSYPSLACSNKIPHLPGSQSPAFAVNSQFSIGNSNPSPSSRVLSNEATEIDNQGKIHQSLKNMQFSGFQQSQGSNVDSGGNNISNAHQRSHIRNNFTRYGKGANMRFQKPQSQHMAKAEGNFRPDHGNWGKGYHSKGTGKSHLANLSKKALGECRRYLPLNYTEEEIRQWREARKKNFPSKANIKKKLAERLSNHKLIDHDAKARRQQLREILAKQAEMGLEVAELSPNYLSESENQASRKELENQGSKREGKRRWNKRGRFQNNYGKGDDKHGRENRWAKKQKSGGDEPFPVSISNKRQPTLLQKLLNADIKRDRSHLLQVFRFMVSNSFFKDGPERPLEFPLITVKDVGIKNDIFKEKSLQERDSTVSGAEEIKHQNYDHSVVDEEDDRGEDDDNYSEGEELTLDNVGIREQFEKSRSEEGEMAE